MFKECPATCGACTTVCQDQDEVPPPFPNRLRQSLPHVYIFSMSLPSLAQHLIPVTLCDQGCKGWAFAKLCTEQPAFMQRVCPAACGICTQIQDNKDEL